ncbi:hypothetical protein TEA_024391 [Camellia sinensis var. sinensis]|uniref:Serine aminopeptidase S33 domain-containing protein n=1 Tax=Camellia sinensis var. sinensis TaxID=542762 RepID=A0A4S4D298_CAMSN|nr:hypothetical protein TEA_024391 [Camellia sinensis var. sinensis]
MRKEEKTEKGGRKREKIDQRSLKKKPVKIDRSSSIVVLVEDEVEGATPCSLNSKGKSKGVRSKLLNRGSKPATKFSPCPLNSASFSHQICVSLSSDSRFCYDSSLEAQNRTSSSKSSPSETIPVTKIEITKRKRKEKSESLSNEKPFDVEAYGASNSTNVFDVLESCSKDLENVCRSRRMVDKGICSPTNEAKIVKEVHLCRSYGVVTGLCLELCCMSFFLGQIQKFTSRKEGTIPAKLILQLTTAFREGGLCDRSGKFFYKDHLHKSKVPILALAGDEDLICPPEAVYETVKLIPEHLVTYEVFGEPEGPHYAHYDLVGENRTQKKKKSSRLPLENLVKTGRVT